MALTIKKFGQGSVAESQKAWKPVLKEWASLMDRYVDAHENDPAPFAYNERANVGLLAGAILLSHKKKNHCLEEYTARKTDSKGRVDLWAVVKEETYLAEAKFGRSSCQNGHPFFTSVRQSTESENVSVRDMLDAAMNQAASYTSDEPSFHVAAAFIVPDITKGQTTKFKHVWKQVLEEELHLGTHSGFVAYYRQNRIKVDTNADCQRYPGVVLFLSFRRYQAPPEST